MLSSWVSIVSLDQWASLGEIIGAIATVATLLYLAIQIRANTTWNKGQALESAIDRITTWGARPSHRRSRLRA